MAEMALKLAIVVDRRFRRACMFSPTWSFGSRNAHRSTWLWLPSHPCRLSGVSTLGRAGSDGAIGTTLMARPKFSLDLIGACQGTTAPSRLNFRASSCG